MAAGELSTVRQMADEDITQFGEELARLGNELTPFPTP
jgi:hypothetical protein